MLQKRERPVLTNSINIPGYTLLETICETNLSRVYKGRKQEGIGQPVVVKVLNREYPKVEEIARFRREYEYLKRVNSPFVIQAHEFVKHKHSVALVIEDFGAESLQSLTQNPPSPRSFLTIALAAASGLADIHAEGIVHKDIAPANIVWNRLDETVKIIDFNYAAELVHGSNCLPKTNSFEGTIAYVSPEQTGRMNRSVDTRSDLYSLGITLYEILTGRLPYDFRDLMELVHAHIARDPIPLSKYRPDMDPTVGAVISKLISKKAEDRYQSALGLRGDLLECLKSVEKTGSIGPIEVGKHDFSFEFRISGKLYGRDTELDALRACFDDVKESPICQFVSVRGEAGTGKSSLIEEIYPHVVENGGFFISGKFDESEKSVPYSAIAQAFDGLVGQLMTSSKERVESWKHRILDAVGQNANIITEIVPSMELIIGETKPLTPLPASAALHRFNFTFLNFFQALPSAEHPLVMFLDDMHWADTGSLKLLELALIDGAVPHLAVIGSFRDEQIVSEDSLGKTLELIRGSGVARNPVEIGPLGLDSICELLTDIFGRSADVIAPLGAVCLEKTGGNPFFLNAFLKSLYEQNLVHHDKNTGRFEWDIPEIRSKDITDNVVDLLYRNLDKLSSNAKRILEIASGVGRSFDLETLVHLTDEDSQRVLDSIREAMRVGLVTLVGRDAAPSGGTAGGMRSTDGTLEYRFVHDRIREAAFARMPKDARQELHLAIARRLAVAAKGASDNDLYLFDIANHFNAARDLLDEKNEQLEAARYNLVAAAKARASLAIGPALTYLDEGVGFLPRMKWISEYDLTLSLMTQTVECAQLALDLEKMEEACEEILINARNGVDKSPVFETRITHYVSSRRLVEAVDMCVEGLRLLGIPVPRKPSTLRILRTFMKARWMMKGKTIQDLDKLPPMRDKRAMCALRLVRNSGLSAYLSEPNLVPILSAETMMLTLKYGLSPHAAVGILGYGFVLLGPFKKIEEGFEISKWSLGLPDRFGDVSALPAALCVYHMVVHHWKKPLKGTVDIIDGLKQMAMENGSPSWAVFARHLLIVQCFWRQRDLREQITVIDENIRFMHKQEQEWFYVMNTFLRYTQGRLQGDKEPPIDVSTNKPFDVDGFLDRLSPMDLSSRAMYNINLCSVNYVEQNFESSLTFAEAANPLIQAVVSSMFEAGHVMFYCLALLAVAQKQGVKSGKKIRKATALIKKMRNWADNSPENFRSKQLFMEAEMLRTLGKGDLAMEKYDSALKEAKKSELIFDEALVAERLAGFFADRGIEKAAEVYRFEAYYAFKRFGADAKVRSLESAHPELVKRWMERTSIPSSASWSSSNTDSGSGSFSGLDLDAIVKSTQAISGEIVLKKLIQKVMRIVLENAGARRGVLALYRQGTLYLEAEYEIDFEEVVFESIPVDEVSRLDSPLPLEIVNFVANSGKTVVLDDATSEGQFTAEPYVRKAKARSVICMPINHLGETTGIIYLENNIVSNAFTRDRIEVLEILCSQIAVSANNALLFKNNEDLMKSFERFVPAEFLNLLEKQSIVDIQLGDGVEKEMTVLFSDIRSFTPLIESLTTKEAFHFINEYLSVMEPAILSSGGFINQYIGDAIMALFAVEPQKAVEAAVKMTRSLASYNQQRKNRGERQIVLGIGLHTGPLMLGTIGGPKRLDCGVISDTVNTTARLETLTKYFGATVLVSDYLYGKMTNPQQFRMRVAGRVVVKGKTRPVTVYEVLDAAPPGRLEKKVETKKLFEESLEKFWEGSFQQALVGFSRCLKIDPDDPAVANYLGQCKKLITKPPGKDWDGVTRLTTK